MLLDPLEKQFNLPAVSVKIGHGFGGYIKIVCKKNKISVAFLIKIFYAPEFFRIFFGTEPMIQANNLVTSESDGFVDDIGINSFKPQITMSSDDKESLSLVN